MYIRVLYFFYLHNQFKIVNYKYKTPFKNEIIHISICILKILIIHKIHTFLFTINDQHNRNCNIIVKKTYNNLITFLDDVVSFVLLFNIIFKFNCI